MGKHGFLSLWCGVYRNQPLHTSGERQGGWQCYEAGHAVMRGSCPVPGAPSDVGGSQGPSVPQAGSDSPLEHLNEHLSPSASPDFANTGCSRRGREAPARRQRGEQLFVPGWRLPAAALPPRPGQSGAGRAPGCGSQLGTRRRCPPRRAGAGRREASAVTALEPQLPAGPPLCLPPPIADQ